MAVRTKRAPARKSTTTKRAAARTTTKPRVTKADLERKIVALEASNRRKKDREQYNLATIDRLRADRNRQRQLVREAQDLIQASEDLLLQQEQAAELDGAIILSAVRTLASKG